MKPFFDVQAWSTIEKHSMFYNLSVHLVLFESLRDWLVEERRSPGYEVVYGISILQFPCKRTLLHSFLVTTMEHDWMCWKCLEVKNLNMIECDVCEKWYHW